jgi:hypothetical protein
MLKSNNSGKLEGHLIGVTSTKAWQWKRHARCAAMVYMARWCRRSTYNWATIGLADSPLLSERIKSASCIQSLNACDFMGIGED